MVTATRRDLDMQVPVIMTSTIQNTTSMLDKATTTLANITSIQPTAWMSTSGKIHLLKLQRMNKSLSIIGFQTITTCLKPSMNSFSTQNHGMSPKSILLIS